MQNAPTRIVSLVTGTEEWYLNGMLHREDGPAVIYADGVCEWWQQNKLHRTDGPAVETPGGYKEWWQNGIKVS
jgi:hypothetical protein